MRTISDDDNVVADADVILQLYVCPAGAVGDGTWAGVRNTQPDESAAEVNRTAATFDPTGDAGRGRGPRMTTQRRAVR